VRSLDDEFKVASAQVGYMLRWLKYQQENKGFVDANVELVENIITSIKQCEKWRDAIYRRKRKLGELQSDAASPKYPDVTEKDVEASVGAMCVNMLYIGQIWIGFQKLKLNFPVMPSVKGKKARDEDALLEYEYDPEKYA
jgi:hypothetical protein